MGCSRPSAGVERKRLATKVPFDQRRFGGQLRTLFALTPIQKKIEPSFEMTVLDLVGQVKQTFRALSRQSQYRPDRRNRINGSIRLRPVIGSTGSISLPFLEEAASSQHMEISARKQQPYREVCCPRVGKSGRRRALRRNLE